MPNDFSSSSSAIISLLSSTGSNITNSTGGDIYHESGWGLWNYVPAGVLAGLALAIVVVTAYCCYGHRTTKANNEKTSLLTLDDGAQSDASRGGTNSISSYGSAGVSPDTLLPQTDSTSTMTDDHHEPAVELDSSSSSSFSNSSSSSSLSMSPS